MSNTDITYPATRTEDCTEAIMGLEYTDPYRWLEGNTDEVRQWQTAQGKLATDYVRGWPHYEAVEKSVAQFWVERPGPVPRYAGGKWFRTERPEGATQATVLIADSPYGNDQQLFDPRDENPDAPPFISWLSPSPNGQVLAIGVCADGSEKNTIRLVDTKSGKQLLNPPPQLLMDAWTNGACWLPDSSGFYFLGLIGDPQNIKQRILFHDLAMGSQTQADIALPDAIPHYTQVTASAQGRYLLAHYNLFAPYPIAIFDLHQPDLHWQPFITTFDGTLAGHIVNDRYIAVTDLNAPRGRVVSILLDSQTPDDPNTWTELVAESNAVIRMVTPVGDLLYLTELVDTYSRVRIVNLSGEIIGEVPLPDKGAIAELPFPMMNLVAKGHPEEFLFSFSSLTESTGVYRHRPGNRNIDTLFAPQISIDNAIVEDHWATSADGTQVPYHCVRLKSTSDARPQPTLISAYGAYNVPWMPQYLSTLAAFVAGGGVLVHAHIRGGAEFGREWWEGGRMKNKQNCYKDLYAIAEDLISKEKTTAEYLAMTGGSNGGLMAGVAMTQRPDLWKAVVPRAPLLDLIGGLRDAYCRYAVEVEFCDPNDADEIRRMADFSPYHLVQDNTEYPAVYINAGDTDLRCAPWHARKFGARLQTSKVNKAPVLIHVWENVGHGWATAKDIQIVEHAEWIAFIMRQLGMTP